VFFVGYGKGTGTAWFDDLVLEEIAADFTTLQVTREPTCPGAISPFQYGQFIEYLCALTPSMFAEKLFDGSFEGVPEYRFVFRKETDRLEQPWYPDGSVYRGEFVLDTVDPFNGKQSQRITMEPGDACTLGGGTFVTDDIFAPATTTDFTPYMEQIANSGAEAYIVTWAGSGFVALVQAAEDQGVNETMALGATFIDNALMPTFFANAVGTTAGILYHWSAPNNPANDFLKAEDKARYGVMPDLFDADGMNAAIMVVEAVKKTNGDVSGDVLVKAMEGMTFDGPKGTIEIRPEDHVALQDMYILKLVNVTDPDANFYEYVDTTRPEPPCLLPETLKDRCGDLPYGNLSGQ